jgi:iron complex transport system permease protein
LSNKVLVCIFLLILFFLLNLKIGYSFISWKTIFDFILDSSVNQTENLILNLRLSKIISVCLVGISLPVSGFLLQEIFKNPLAGPSVLGITPSSSLFVALFIFLGGTIYFENSLITNWLIVICSIVGAFLCLILLLLFRKRMNSTSNLILIGFLISSFAGTIISILEYFSSNQEIKTYIIWSFGSFNGLTFDKIFVFTFFVFLGLFFAFQSVHSLKGISLGEIYGKSFGVNVSKLYFLVIISTCLLVGSCTAFVGPISFIGIIIPHFCRLIHNPSKLWNQFTLNILVGSVLLLFFLFISELIKIPINIISVLLGIPTMFLIIFKNKQFLA